MPETNGAHDERRPTLSAADLTPGEAARFRAVLRAYLPGLDTDDELSGGDAVEKLGELCEALDSLGDFSIFEQAAEG